MKNIKLIVLSIVLIISFLGKSQTRNNDSIGYRDSLIILELESITHNDTLTLKNLYLEILKDSIKFPEIVLKQAIHETGWLKSNYCINRHNLFGFRSAKGYIYYDSWQASVLAYKKWQDKHYNGGDYYQFLINIHYAGNGIEYTNCLKKIKIPKYVFEN